MRSGGMRAAMAVAAATAVLLAAPTRGQEPPGHEQMAGMDHQHMAGMSASEHAAHMAMLAAPSYSVVAADYVVPDVVLKDQDGREVGLQDLLGDDRPVAINFIYTSCTTICPVMTATMLQLEHQLRDASPRPRYVSISIDPDFDTATTLHSYAKRFGADWTFLTGRREAVLEVLNAFSAWRGSKTNHVAITVFRPAGADHWTRVEGLASARQLVDIWNGISSG